MKATIKITKEEKYRIALLAIITATKQGVKVNGDICMTFGLAKAIANARLIYNRNNRERKI